MPLSGTTADNASDAGASARTSGHSWLLKFPQKLPIGRYYGRMPGAYPRRTGLYVYVVIVTKDDLQPSARRYRAYMTNVEPVCRHHCVERRGSSSR